ncbi:aldo/keto reductase [Kitasatospora paracochleata]|uniref:D-threo-aldose 1-dehydrogenase n=1 Tax=Kitasatospora paracochleata TaxID=58354 RepID=A0ABT1J9Q8_9ACTN|nr:aldo/keto reductase [Kitasatospora paracochleata]MCP2314192.1 D-threo-aldose 1-dehydrogenase [Kitasatospora paracochleata]
MIEISRHGFGAATLGNLYTEVADDQAEQAVQAAWHAGVRLFDTAPHYGLGLSERRLGRALSAYPRDSYVLSTKVGRLLLPADSEGLDPDGFLVPATHRRVWDFSADGVRRSIEDSLDRMGLDRIDIVLLHDAESHLPQAVREAYPALADLRAQGVIRAIGAGMNHCRPLETLVRETDIDTVMIAGRYTLLDQSAGASLLPTCLERGVAVLAAGVFNSGLLATDGTGGTYDYHPAPAHLIDRARRIAQVCEQYEVTLPQAALAFPLRHPAVSSVVVGARSASEVRRNAELLAREIPEALWADLVALSLEDPQSFRR